MFDPFLNEIKTILLIVPNKKLFIYHLESIRIDEELGVVRNLVYEDEKFYFQTLMN